MQLQDIKSLGQLYVFFWMIAMLLCNPDAFLYLKDKFYSQYSLCAHNRALQIIVFSQIKLSCAGNFYFPENVQQVIKILVN